MLAAAVLVASPPSGPPIDQRTGWYLTPKRKSNNSGSGPLRMAGARRTDGRLTRRASFGVWRGTSLVCPAAPPPALRWHADGWAVYAVYRTNVRALQLVVREAKTRAWKELLRNLESYPWGRPYKLVTGKLWLWTLPLMVALELPLLGRVVDTLFPLQVGVVRGRPLVAETAPHSELTWSDAWGVMRSELAGAVRWLGERNTAPGSDGILDRAWVLAVGALEVRL